MNTQAVIFDMDGVIINSEEIWDIANKEFFKEHGGEFTEEMRVTIMGTRVDFWTQYFINLLNLEAEWTRDKVAQRLFNRIHGLYETDVKLMPGYTELMNKIKTTDIKRGLATGSGPNFISLVLNRFNLHDDFEVTVSVNEVEEGKPSPAVYLKTAELLGVDPTLCVGIEDSPNGTLSVKAAHMKCIAVPDPFLTKHPAFAQADIVRQSLTEVTIDDIEIER